jgi:hypothetical protein
MSLLIPPPPVNRHKLQNSTIYGHEVFFRRIYSKLAMMGMNDEGRENLTVYTYSRKYYPIRPNIP